VALCIRWRRFSAASPEIPLLHTLIGHTDIVNSVAFSPDGKTLGSGDATVKLWDVASGKELYSAITNWVFASALSPDGKQLVTGHGDGSIKLWEMMGL
jgi:WD40 repeat protein